MKQYTEQDMDKAYDMGVIKGMEMGVKKGFQDAMDSLDIEKQTGVADYVEIEMEDIPLKVYYYLEGGCKGNYDTPDTPDSVFIEAVTTTYNGTDISPLLSKDMIDKLRYELEYIIFS